MQKARTATFLIWIVVAGLVSLEIQRVMLFLFEYQVMSTQYPNLKSNFMAELTASISSFWVLKWAWPSGGEIPMLLTCLYGFVAGLHLHKKPIWIIPVVVLVVTVIVDLVYISKMTTNRPDFFREQAFWRIGILVVLALAGTAIDRFFTQYVQPWFEYLFEGVQKRKTARGKAHA